ncbi:MAG: flavin reductase family protein [Candidatus Thorarchaeota archaeon]
MSKLEINPGVSPYPMPVVLVGADVHKKPNFMAVAWFNKMNGRPPVWAVSIGKKQYTLIGIRENRTFSINFPSTKHMQVTDYCGIYSGRDVDKSSLFNVFYGKVGTAPMINEATLTIELEVVDIMESLEVCDIVLGEVKAAYTEEEYQSNGILDPRKLDPFVLTQPDNHYWSIGEIVGNAFKDGKNYST